MKKTKSKLYQLYQTHGALTLMLALYPMLPTVVELHTKAYLALIKAFAGSIDDIRNTIRIIFGQRGLGVYEEYMKVARQKILPGMIFTAFFEGKKNEGLKLMSEMFFDRKQREGIDSDKFRAAVILAIPQILTNFSGENNKNFRSRLVGLLANQAIIDQSITSQLAFIETAAQMLIHTLKEKGKKRQAELSALYSSIEAKIKAELAGKASAFSAPLNFPVISEDQIFLTPDDEHNLKEVMLLLSLSPAPEIAQKARDAIKILETELKNIA